MSKTPIETQLDSITDAFRSSTAEWETDAKAYRARILELEAQLERSKGHAEFLRDTLLVIIGRRP
jgi:hypothetical protein